MTRLYTVKMKTGETEKTYLVEAITQHQAISRVSEGMFFVSIPSPKEVVSLMKDDSAIILSLNSQQD